MAHRSPLCLIGVLDREFTVVAKDMLGHFSPDQTMRWTEFHLEDNGRVLPYLNPAKGGANDS